MDAEEIQNRLQTLSRQNFRNVVAMILGQVFGFPALSVDGKGDGGTDWYLFDTGGKKIRLGVQDTIQLQKWQDKALEDALKAKAAHGINRYFFCTNRPHEQITVTALENRITEATGLSATVLEARRLAELITQGGLEEKFLEAIGIGTASKPPRAPEMALCVYTNLSADRSNHRNEIYSDTLLVVCRDKQPIEREQLIEGALGFLGSAPGQRQLVDRRIDALLSERKLILDHTSKKLSLSTATATRIGQTERLYLSDWASLSGAQTQIVRDYGGTWAEEQAEQANVFIARLFIREQLLNLKSAGAEILQGRWLDPSGDPKQQLRDLVQLAGVPLSKISESVAKLVDLARNRQVIAKLTRTAVFAALEGQNPLQSAKAIGASGWDDVSLLLDASVAIPFLCSSRTEAVDNYLYALSSRAVEALRDLGATAWITPGHLEECSSHLLRAFRYQSLETDTDFAAALRRSENAFIAFYYALRNEGRRAPSSLQQFLQIFSEEAPAVVRGAGRWRDRVLQTMPDLQEALSEYEVQVLHLARPTRERMEALEKAHDWAMMGEKREKSGLLRRHDLDALAHVETLAQNRESWLFLTWDKAVIRLAKDQLRNAWVISPEIAMDFAQPCRRLSETQWTTLAHRLARVSDPGDTLTAKILDRVAKLNYERLQDWEFKQQIRTFRKEALARLPLEQDANFHSWVEGEAKAFLLSHDILARQDEAADIVDEELNWTDDP